MPFSAARFFMGENSADRLSAICISADYLSADSFLADRLSVDRLLADRFLAPNSEKITLCD